MRWALSLGKRRRIVSLKMKKSASLFTGADGRNHLFTFALVSSLFLIWGICNGMIDVMDKHFQDKLHLTKAQSAWVQFSHYMGYCLVSLPAGYLARRVGYRGGIITGLLVVAAGGFWFILAASRNTLGFFLAGVFILASGLTFLETVANPYTTVLGGRNYASTRINLAQSVNGIGWILGPIIGGIFFYSSGPSTVERLDVPYVAVAVVVLVLAIVFFFAPMPDIEIEDDYHLDDAVRGVSKSIWSHPHFVLAVAAQFLYIAAQAGIFSFFINYMVEEIPSISIHAASSWFLANGTEARDGAVFINEQGAARLLGYGGFVLFLLGRVTGSALLSRFAANRVLGLYAAVNVVLMALIFAKLGWLSVGALFLSFFFMSIMFPTIFALGIHGLGEQAKKASSFIVMAILGGALVPKLMGWVGDHYGMSKGFLVPLICFAGIAGYGFFWERWSTRKAHAPKDITKQQK